MLPPVIEKLVGIVGIDAVQALVDTRLLGYRQRIGRSRECEWWREWSDVIGEGLTDAVMKVWAGEQIYFPACADAVRAERNRQIVAAFDQLLVEGCSARRALRKLSRKYRLSDRHLEQFVINRPTQAASEIEKQLNLF